MKKLINSLLYGSEQTKSYMIAIALLSALTVVFGALSVINFSFGFGIFCVLAGVLDGILLQSVTFEDETYLLKRKAEAQRKKEQKRAERSHAAGRDAREDKQAQQEDGQAEGSEKEREGIEEEEGEAPSKNRKKRPPNLEEVSAETETEEEEGAYQQYNREKVKQILHKYKVKEEHRRVMVDLCVPFRIRQCPAYIWKNKKNLYFLLLEEEPRRIEIPLQKIDGVRYERGALVKSSMDYDEFRAPSFVGSIFMPYLPTYYEKNKNGKRQYCKNLYVITPELKVTNTSARNLFDVLGADFLLSDSVMSAAKFSPYFKMAYKSNILLRDRVISPEEYKEKIRVLLTSISQGEMDQREYDGLIDQLEQYKLITDEYAKYYRKEGRDKRDGSP